MSDADRQDQTPHHSRWRDPTPEQPTDPDYFAPPSGTRERTWDIVAVIAAGGAIGGAGRYSLTLLWPHDGFDFPWATFAANVSGSLLLGALMVFLFDVWGPHRYTRPFLGVGVLGGYTTFSTFTNEVDVLLRSGQAAVALVYVFASVAAGLLAALCGIACARRIAGVSSGRRAIG